MLELVGIYLLGILASSIFINLCEWWFKGYDIRLMDVFHPYHFLSWFLIIFYIGIHVNDYLDSDKNPFGKIIKWAKNKTILKKRQ